MTTARLVCPGDIFEQAARVLARAWPAPAIHYSHDYLGWQLRFPGEPGALMAATFDGDRVTGVFGAVPRRMALGGRVQRLHLVSFLGVDPDYQRQGLARELYRVLLAELRAREQPFVIFAKTDTAGHALIQSEPVTTGFHGTSLGDYDIYGFMARGADATVDAVECDDLPALAARIAEQATAQTLHSRPDLLQLQHYASGGDRRIIIARDEAGRITGAATIARIAYTAAAGIEQTTIVDSFLVPPESAEVLKALLTCAARAYAVEGTPAMCTVPNASGIDEAWFRPACLRRTPTRYCGIVYAPRPDHPLLSATRTNLEIV